MSAAAAVVRRIRSRPSKRAPSRLHALALPPRLRRRLLALAVIAAVLSGLYLFVLRDLGIVGVEKVRVRGLAGSSDTARATAALQAAARKSTTLHVDSDALREVARQFPVIKSVSVHTNFPHGMRIEVTQQRPAAMLVIGTRKVPVAGDGAVLTSLPAAGALPTVKVQGDVPVKRLTPSGTLDAVRVAGGAPAPLTATLASVTRRGDKGWVVTMRDGPDLIFGPATSVAEKWRAATRVLADRDASGADYIDLRIPGRPAAGGLPVQTIQPVAPAGSAGDDPAVDPPLQGSPATPSAAAPQPAAPAPSPSGAGTPPRSLQP